MLMNNWLIMFTINKMVMQHSAITNKFFIPEYFIIFSYGISIIISIM
jgi:hypothetical protein